MTLPCVLPSFLCLPGVPRNAGVVLVLRKKAIAECKKADLKPLDEPSCELALLFRRMEASRSQSSRSSSARHLEWEDGQCRWNPYEPFV